jgi:hypothetical protein
MDMLLPRSGHGFPAYSATFTVVGGTLWRKALT